MMDYQLYHDESKVAGYWHGILLVPDIHRSDVLSMLDRARKGSGYCHPISLKQVKKENGPLYNCAHSWILLGIGLMRTKRGKSTYSIHYGEKQCGRLIYEPLKDCFGLKFILLREKNDHQDMNFLSYSQKVETTFRIGLKGGLNFLSSEDNPINITRMHFAGYEHNQRHYDRDRIIGRLNGLRQYCAVSNDDSIIDDRSGRHNKEDSQDYDDCQLLQLTDLLVGSFRTLLGTCTRESHKSLAYSANLPVQAYLEGEKRFSNSRWYGSFCMSQCEIVEGNWVFSKIEPYSITNDSEQLSLFKDNS